MTRQRLFGAQLEFLLAELMAPPGKHNYKISRYIVLDGELDLEALVAAAERTFQEMDMVHYNYEIDATGAWRSASDKGPCKVRVVDLRDVEDPMRRCMETIMGDANKIVPLLGQEDQITAMVFVLEESGTRRRVVYYHRFHHAEVDGYMGQLAVRRLAERYNAYSSRSEPRRADFLGYAALLEEEERYVGSGECSADQAFWSEYLRDYLSRTDDVVTRGVEPSAELLSPSIRIARRTGGVSRLPIDAITAAIMMTLYQASGVACQMIGMTFMRRSNEKLARLMSPMVTVLPLWVDLGRHHERGAIVSQVAEAIQQIKEHQSYSGERALRDLGHTGRDALYLCTVNYRVFDKAPIVFDRVESTSHIISSGAVMGITIIVGVQDDGLQLAIESVYKVVYGLELGALCELLEDNLVAMLGDDYYKRTESISRAGYTELRPRASGG